MKLINRKSEEVILNGSRSVRRQYITVESNRIYFTAAASRVCGLQAGLYINFLNEGKDWQFFVNGDPDGFKLTVVTAKNGFHVTSTGLCKMILDSTEFKSPKRFVITKSSGMQGKFPVFTLTPTLSQQRSRS